MNNLNKNNNSDDNTEYQICKACKTIIPLGVTVCHKCGSPTRIFFRWFYIYRGFLTALGSIIVAAGILFLIYNLHHTQEIIRNQQNSFIQEFQPKIETVYNGCEQQGDSLRIKIKVLNAGHSDAIEIKGNLYILNTVKDTMVTDEFYEDRLIGNGERMRIFEVPNLFAGIFYVCFDIDYIWNGENTIKYFESSYEIQLDSTDNNYKGYRISKNEILNR